MVFPSLFESSPISSMCYGLTFKYCNTLFIQLCSTHFKLNFSNGWCSKKRLDAMDTGPSAPPSNTSKHRCQRFIIFCCCNLKLKLSSCCVLSNHVHCLTLNSCRAETESSDWWPQTVSMTHTASSLLLLLPAPSDLSYTVHWVWVTDVTNDINNGWVPFRYVAWAISNVSTANICSVRNYHLYNHCYYCCSIVASSFSSFKIKPTRKTVITKHSMDLTVKRLNDAVWTSKFFFWFFFQIYR